MAHEVPLCRQREKARLKLEKKSTTIRKGIAQFQDSILQLRNQLGGNLRAAHVLNPQITSDCNLADVIAYLDTFKKQLKALKIPQGKGKPSVSGQSAGEFLYKTYKRVFGAPPKSGKGRQPYKDRPVQITGYDKLCKIIAGAYKVEISYDARTVSWKARKKPGYKSKK